MDYDKCHKLFKGWMSTNPNISPIILYALINWPLQNIVLTNRTHVTILYNINISVLSSSVNNKDEDWRKKLVWISPFHNYYNWITCYIVTWWLYIYFILSQCIFYDSKLNDTNITQ